MTPTPTILHRAVAEAGFTRHPARRRRLVARAYALAELLAPELDALHEAELARSLHPRSTTRAMLASTLGQLGARATWGVFGARHGILREHPGLAPEASPDARAAALERLALPEIPLPPGCAASFDRVVRDAAWRTGVRWAVVGEGFRGFLYGAWSGGVEVLPPLSNVSVQRTGRHYRLVGDEGSVVLPDTTVLVPDDDATLRDLPPGGAAPPTLAIAVRGVRSLLARADLLTGYRDHRRAAACLAALDAPLAAAVAAGAPDPRPALRESLAPHDLDRPPDADALAAAALAVALDTPPPDDVWHLPGEAIGPGGEPLADWLDNAHADGTILVDAAAAALLAATVGAGGHRALAGWLASAADPTAAADRARLLWKDRRDEVFALARALAWTGALPVDGVTALLRGIRGEDAAFAEVRLALQLAALDEARALGRDAARWLTWDYEVEPARPGDFEIEGSHTTYGPDVHLTVFGVRQADLPQRWSHPLFSTEPPPEASDPYGVVLRVETEWGSSSAREVFVEAAAILVHEEPARSGGASPNPTAHAVELFQDLPKESPGADAAPCAGLYAPCPADAWLLDDPGTPLPPLPDPRLEGPLLRARLLGVDGHPRERELPLREATALRDDALGFLKEDPLEAEARALVHLLPRVERERAAFAVAAPDEAWRRAALREATLAAASRALGLPVGEVAVPARTVGASRIVADPLARATWSEALRVATLAADLAADGALSAPAGDDRPLPAIERLLRDPGDQGRAHLAATVLRENAPVILRLADALAVRGRLGANEVDALCAGDEAAWRSARQEAARRYLHGFPRS